MGVHLQDFRFALRVLRRQPMFVAVAALTVAIGVSGTATIFSAANSLLLRPPTGVTDSGSLVTVHRIDAQGTSFHAFGIPAFRELAAAGAVEELVAYDIFAGGMALEQEAARIGGALVSGNYFRALGTGTALGRVFGPDEDNVPGQHPVAVISFSLWERLFSSDPDAVGRDVRINGRMFTIIGVAEEGFEGHIAVFPTEVWLPLSAQGVIFGLEDLSDAAARISVEIFGRLQPGQSTQQAQQALDAAGAAEAANRGIDWFGLEVLAYSPIFAAARQPLMAFLGALFVVAGVLLTITAVNVANMLLSRGASRSAEIGVRLAMGATRSRLIAQLLTESAVLFFLGGLGGVLLTYWWTGLLAAFSLPIPIELNLDLSPDLAVMAFALAVAGLTGVLFGLSPALSATRVDLVSSLKDTTAAAAGKQRMRNFLVFAQVAGSAVLLVSAGLLVRSVGAAGATDLGLEPDGVTVVLVDTGAAGRSADETDLFFDNVLEQTRQTPGVENAAFIDVVPLTLSNAQTRIVIPGLPAEPEEGLRIVEAAGVSPGYFDTVRIPLLAGRDFDDSDRDGAPVVIIVNELLAETAFPGESPIGKHLGIGSATEPIDAEIIGLARNSKIRSAGDPPRNLMYTSMAQFGGDPNLLIRTDSEAAITEARERIRALDPVLPPAFVVAYPDFAGLSMLPSRMAAVLAAAFGLVGTLLAAIGLYGLLALSVAQRSREIGIRLALGADPREVQRLVVGRGLRVTTVGLVFGLLAAAGVGQLMSGLLFGVSPFDPLTYLMIAAVLLVVALLACWLPARRAAATDPVIALRAE